MKIQNEKKGNIIIEDASGKVQVLGLSLDGIWTGDTLSVSGCRSSKGLSYPCLVTNNLSRRHKGKLAYDNLDVKPSFMGGDVTKFSNWVSSMLVYPPDAKAAGISGTVRVQFTVEADGTVDNVKIVERYYLSLDEEAARVVYTSPKWSPAMKDGKAVPATLEIPIIFILQQKTSPERK